MYLGLLASAVTTCIFLYLVVWVRCVRRIHLDWALWAPGAIESATGATVLAFLSFLIALFPLYGMLTPLLEVVILVGWVMLSHFIPTWALGREGEVGTAG